MCYLALPDDGCAIINTNLTEQLKRYGFDYTACELKLRTTIFEFFSHALQKLKRVKMLKSANQSSPPFCVSALFFKEIEVSVILN